ncbi:zinc finger BED domain-containing protein 4 [Trichonephila clavata]|uniref:Zinc finger BED domain-containing protein 4 n=1 Tax=Trichonephila clavata TaxID=2740835 RepID=A0A8X6JP74_TRICU|nr:zinc finger BED domain-containing protein 4 [Trichonephila clavata]
MIGNHAANLERHLKRHHSNEFKTIQQKKKIKLNIRDEATPSTSGSSGSQETLDKYVKSEFLKVKLNKEIVLKACIKLITVNGCSFEMLEYSGFKKILNPIVNAIGNHFSVNSENIKLLIPETAVKIVSEISTSTRKKK